jgi:hypothetical protein
MIEDSRTGLRQSLHISTNGNKNQIVQLKAVTEPRRGRGMIDCIEKLTIVLQTGNNWVSNVFFLTQFWQINFIKQYVIILSEIVSIWQKNCKNSVKELSEFWQELSEFCRKFVRIFSQNFICKKFEKLVQKLIWLFLFQCPKRVNQMLINRRNVTRIHEKRNGNFFPLICRQNQIHGDGRRTVKFMSILRTLRTLIIIYFACP